MVRVLYGSRRTTVNLLSIHVMVRDEVYSLRHLIIFSYSNESAFQWKFDCFEISWRAGLDEEFFQIQSELTCATLKAHKEYVDLLR